eukprot:887340-Lingulodinium_polyedra.AAC.1
MPNWLLPVAGSCTWRTWSRSRHSLHSEVQCSGPTPRPPGYPNLIGGQSTCQPRLSFIRSGSSSAPPL